MMAWMNDEALRKTLDTGIAHYWSRSRRTLWKKGETSGALQHVVSASIDCDQDTLLLSVRADNIGQTCHTARNTCFYRTIVRDPADPSGFKLLIDDGPADK
jgi:phosphoribosyl-AMP cyclohydrolase